MREKAPGSGGGPEGSAARVTSRSAEGLYDALEKYGIDFTKNAEDGKLDPVIGRDDEIRRAIQILSRRTKNNPVLIGDPGVGKFIYNLCIYFLSILHQCIFPYTAFCKSHINFPPSSFHPSFFYPM